MCIICNRRNFLGAVLSAGAAAAIPSRTFARPALPPGFKGRDGLPVRGEFVVTNAYVISMDEQVGEVANGAIHVRDGAIISVGTQVPHGVPVINGAGMIALPGYVDTHWHMWHTIFRGFSGETPATGFFPTIARLGAAMTAQDMHDSTRLAAAEAISSGITTVHDWCHNIRSVEHAQADIRALTETGLRAQWSFGQRIDQPVNEVIRLDWLRQFSNEWERYSNGGLISLGMAWRGMFRHQAVPERVYRTEFDTARELKLPISVHIGTIAAETQGDIESHYKAGFLGKNVNVVHATSASAAEIGMLRDSGANVSVLPWSEMLGGWGYPKLPELLDGNVPTALGVDSALLIGTANPFNVLKLAMAIENSSSGDPYKMSPRQALKLGTIQAAKVMGIDDKVGSLTPGKRADLVLVSTNSLNMAVAADPAHLVVEATMPENIDTVVIDGRILKSGGQLTSIDSTQVITAARAALDRVRKAAHWR